MADHGDRATGTGAWGRAVLVNGRPGLVVFDGTHAGVVAFTVDAGRIVAIDIVRNPDKLRDLPTGGTPDWYLGADPNPQPQPRNGITHPRTGGLLEEAARFRASTRRP
ncbi:hypothetical protein [Nocardia australiensis]|uniref:hypothetical protein n=1 Tax=Nocardia australiensis TaxID=2887191 RepID=UPI001D156708|nr:hypothetical protein [Nocardia australiensis]